MMHYFICTSIFDETEWYAIIWKDCQKLGMRVWQVKKSKQNFDSITSQLLNNTLKSGLGAHVVNISETLAPRYEYDILRLKSSTVLKY